MNRILNEVADSIKFELPDEEINIKLPKMSDILKQGLKAKFRRAKKTYKKYSKKKCQQKRHDQHDRVNQRDETLINSILREC